MKSQGDVAARRATLFTVVTLFLPLCSVMSSAVRAAEERPRPILLDTDIGSDVDDAFALALVLASPELELRGVSTVSGDTQARARIVCRLLTAVGRRDIPVAAGAAPQPEQALSGQEQYARHPAVIFHRTSQPVRESAVELLYHQLRRQPGLTVVSLGPLTNLARLLREHPDCKPWIERIVLMGGSLRVGYAGKPPPEVEWNIRCDIPAARAVFSSGVPLVVAPLDATLVKLEQEARHKLFAAKTPLTLQLQALYQMWNAPTPTLFDPVAVALCFTDRFCRLEELHIEVDAQGFTRVGPGKPNARAAVSIDTEAFVRWYVDRLAGFGKPVRTRPPGNRSSLVEPGRLPLRVHAAEDFETDIEKRWWMSGKAEADNVPPRSKRACRGILTQDFDDLQGDMQAMYTAVIFNPVPGPPMGSHTRLSFRYWLRGTDTLRVQLYSLSKGYHRYLSLAGLPEGRWRRATVDMTACRRPDGTGGPLSAGERIDDIQFYADPAAELLIDDIVLYEAAPADEQRPFPRRIHFTGWFDTGRQGQEWPGAFTIVPLDSGNRAAESVPGPRGGTPGIRLGLRGPRPLGPSTHLRFRYHLTGASSLRVVLVSRTQKEGHVVTLEDLARDRWSEATIDFQTQSTRADGSKGGPRAGEVCEEIQFFVPEGGRLRIDDVLLYEPGS